MINEYKFRGRLNKCFNSDKIYIDESRGSWSKKFDNVIKNCLISNGVVQKSNFDLSYLHENVSNNFMKTDTAGDGISNLGKLFYEIKDEKYFDLYHSFLYWLRYKILKCDFYFQKTPTIRFWFAGQKTLPRYHTDIDLVLSVNGKIKQSGSCKDMIWSPVQIISKLATEIPLYPGDLIFTGTPEGVGTIVKGDKVTASIPGMVELSFSII